MVKRKIEDIVTELVQPITERHEFVLVDVEFLKEGSNWYLRVYIDKPGGIMIDDCQVVSEELSEKLDKVDPIEQSYFLEVSSPGLDRMLKKDSDFERYKGETVEVKVYKPIDGQKVFEGELLDHENNSISIKRSDSEIIRFDKNDIASVKRVVKF